MSELVAVVPVYVPWVVSAVPVASLGTEELLVGALGASAASVETDEVRERYWPGILLTSKVSHSFANLKSCWTYYAVESLDSLQLVLLQWVEIGLTR